MDLTTFIKDGYFLESVRKLSHEKKYHALLFHASGTNDPNVITDFQKSVYEYYPLLRGYTPKGLVEPLPPAPTSHTSPDK